MPSPLEFAYAFHPVGQGLFASGMLACNGMPAFNWVYDCGTSSSQSLIEQALNGYPRPIPYKPTGEIPLLVVSHFDNDHINGVEHLLARFRVGVLMLPYMTLAQRLIVAFAENLDASQRAAKTYLNPVRSFAEMAKKGLKEIVFVPGADGERSVTVEGPEDGESRERFRDWGLLIDRDDNVDPEKFPDFDLLRNAVNSGSDLEVSMLRRGGRVTALYAWEFAPYNDAEQASKVMPAFESKVNAARKNLLSDKPEDSYKEMMSALKNIYDATFGKGPRPRNVISLFLHSGPIENRSIDYLHAVSNHTRGQRRVFCSVETLNIPSPICSILYTGDGLLNTSSRLDSLIATMGQPRIDTLACLQVMHHGAEESWHRGVADRLSPLFSVFSADPGRKRPGHPRGPVVCDFLPYGPMLVDKTRGALFLGGLR